MVPCSVASSLPDSFASSFFGSDVSSNPSSLLNSSYCSATVVDDTMQTHTTNLITALSVSAELAQLTSQSEIRLNQL